MQQQELQKIQDAYDRIFQSIDNAKLSVEKQLEDQQRLNALLMEGFDSEAAQKQVAIERQLKDLQLERATKLQELKGIEGVTQQQLQTGEAEINRIYDERIQKAFQLNQEKEKGNQLLDQAKEKSKQVQAQEQMLVSLYDGIGSTIANGIGGAIDAVASGTEDLGKTLQKLGQQILAQVGKMLIFYALAQAFGALGGSDGKGIFSMLAKGFGFSGGGGVSAPSRFAEGGYVTGPTNALIGEAGESEYVIPSSKMGAAMANYRSGKRGDSVVSDSAMGSDAEDGGNNTFTLETVVINKVEYATVAQVREMGAAAAKQGAQGGYTKTMGSMRNSRSTRARLGMG